ncbi:MAG TPA: hypothetical protein VK061_02075 [Bacillota bacterium]|nr:hypothetical protein [Bacillota bacterium]
MDIPNQKIVLFPKLKERLKNDAAEAYRNKKFEQALDIYESLLSYGETEHEIVFGKVLCLVELKRFSLAQQICEEQLIKNEGNYYDFLHLYALILFQTDQYYALQAQLDFELSQVTLPPYLEEQLQYLYDISCEMIENERKYQKDFLFEKLGKAISEEEVLKQYHLVQEMIESNIEPDDYIISLLSETKVHPVIKTNILLWLKEKRFKQTVPIKKFGQKIEVKPIDLSSVEENHVYKKIKDFIHDKFASEPSSLQMILEMLYRYFFVIYPFVPDETEIEIIIEAMNTIVKSNLDGISHEKTDKDLLKMIKNISQSETLYLSILE